MLKNKTLLGLFVFLILITSVYAGTQEDVEQYIKFSKKEIKNQETNLTELTADMICQSQELPKTFREDAPFFNAQNPKYCINKFELDYDSLKGFSFDKNKLFLTDVDSTADKMVLYVKKSGLESGWDWNKSIEEREDEFGNKYNISVFIWEIVEYNVSVIDEETGEVISSFLRNTTQKQKIITENTYYYYEEIDLTNPKAFSELRNMSDDPKGNSKVDRPLSLALGVEFGKNENGTIHPSVHYGVGVGNKDLASKNLKESEIDISKGIVDLDEFLIYNDPFFNVSSGNFFSKSYLQIGTDADTFRDDFASYTGGSPNSAGAGNNFLQRNEWRMEDQAQWSAGSANRVNVVDSKEGTNAINVEATAGGGGIFVTYVGETNGGLDLSDYETIRGWFKLNDTTSESLKVELRTTASNRNIYTISVDTVDTYQYFIWNLDSPNSTSGSGADLNNVTDIYIIENLATGDHLNSTVDALFLVKSGGFFNQSDGTLKWNSNSGIYFIGNGSDFNGRETEFMQQSDETLADVVNFANDDNKSNLTIQVTAQEFADGGNDFFRILFRGSDTNNYYFANIDNSNFDIYKNEAGTQTLLADNGVTFSITKTNWNFFKLTANGDTLRGYHSTNGATWTEYVNVTDTTFTTGQYGFGMNESAWIIDDYFIVETPDAEFSSSLVFASSFDGSANDESEFRRVPTTNNATKINDCEFGTGGCFEFDAVDDVIAYSDDDAFSLGLRDATSISLKIYPTFNNSANWQVPIGKGVGSNFEWELRYENSQVFTFVVYDGLAPSGDACSVQSSISSVNNTYDVGMVWENNTGCRLYVNENPPIIGTITAGSNIANGNQGVTIGDRGDRGRKFMGRTDEVIIEHKNLTHTDFLDRLRKGGFASQSISKNQNITQIATSYSSDDGGTLGEVVTDFFDGNGSVIYESPRSNLTITGATNSSGDVLDTAINNRGNNGSIVGTAECGKAGRFGLDGCEHDGVGTNYIEFPDLNIDTNNFSFGIFFKIPTDDNLRHTLFSASDTGTFANYLSFRIGNNADGDDLLAEFREGASGSGKIETNVNAKDNKWHCGVVTRTDNSSSVYFDTTTKTTVSDNLEIGALLGSQHRVGALNGFDNVNGTTGKYQLWIDYVLTDLEVEDWCIDGQFNSLDESFTSTKNQSRFANTTAINSLGQKTTITSNTVHTSNSIPTIPSIVQPFNNTYLGGLRVEISIENSTDIDNDAITYYVEAYNDSSLTQIAFTNTSVSETSNTTNLTFTFTEDGDYFIRALSFDGQENSTFSSDVNVTLDTTFPTIYVTSPSNGSTFYTGVPLDVSSDEVNAEAWWYSINDGINTSFSPNTTLIVAVSGDDYFINVYVNDTLGQQNGTDKIYFTRGDIGVGGGGGGSGASGESGKFISNISVIMPSEWEIGEQVKLDLEFLNTLNNLYTPSSVNFFFQPTDYFEKISYTEKSTGKAEAVFRTRFTAIEGNYKIIVVAKSDNEKVEEFNFKVVPKKEKISAENIVEKTVDAGKEIIDQGVAFIQNIERWTNWQKVAVGSAVTFFLSVIVISSVIAIKRKPKFPRRNDELF